MSSAKTPFRKVIIESAYTLASLSPEKWEEAHNRVELCLNLVDIIFVDATRHPLETLNYPNKRL
jgi:hypothetical protein